MPVSYNSPGKPRFGTGGRPSIGGIPDTRPVYAPAQDPEPYYDPASRVTSTSPLYRDVKSGSYLTPSESKGTEAGRALKALSEASGLNLLGSSSASGVGGGGGVGSLPPIAMPDTSAANTAAFGRAKDQAGQTTRASLTALRDEMAARGLRGSGIEGAEVGNTIARGAAGVNEFTREQAIQDARNLTDRASQEYQGRIVQRGQDLSAAQANAARQQQSIQGLLELIGGRGILY